MFFQNAYEGQNRWWRWLLTIFITLLLWMAGHIPLIIFANRETARLGISDLDIDQLVLHPDLDRNLFLLLALVPFVLGFLTLRFLIIRLHKKSLRSVMTGRARFDWGRASLGFAVWFLLVGVAAFAVLPAGSYTYQFNPSVFWPLLAIGLLLIPIQTTLEELFFRGYLMQGISLLIKNKLAPLILVTLMFTFMHISNPEFNTDYTKGFLGYFVVSVLLGVTTVLDDGLEVACGIHAANNVFAAVIFSTKGGSFVTDSIFVTTLSEMMKFSPYADIAICVAGFLIFYYLLGWRFSTLLEPTVPLAHPDESGPKECEDPEVGAVTAER
jgi:membrane protease YdiL (CAAX protease family)